MFAYGGGRLQEESVIPDFLFLRHLVLPCMGHQDKWGIANRLKTGVEGWRGGGSLQDTGFYQQCPLTSWTQHYMFGRWAKVGHRVGDITYMGPLTS